ncbi:pathogenicity island 2 effector protein SseJ [Salmonella enterica subsp. enterica]|nr:pathogenicity island 2 effector protein SseJ [Salmonella enterica subsp. enterica]
MGENQSIFLYHPPCRGASNVSLIFYHHQELNLTPVQVRGAYIKTSSLASQGCKEQFIIESQEHADKLIIKDDNGENILSIELNVIRKAFGLAKEINKSHPKPKNISLGDITRLVFFGDSLSDSLGRMFEKTHHILPSLWSILWRKVLLMDLPGLKFLSSPHFLGKEMLNFAEGGSTSASYSCFNCIGDFVSNTDRQVASYTPSHQDLAIFLLGLMTI